MTGIFITRLGGRSFGESAFVPSASSAPAISHGSHSLLGCLQTSVSTLCSQGQESLSPLGNLVLGSFFLLSAGSGRGISPIRLDVGSFTGTAHLADRCSSPARYSSVFQIGGCLEVLRWTGFPLLGARVGRTHGSVTSFQNPGALEPN